MRLFSLIAALLISQTFAMADDSAPHVQARLIANVSAIEAGKPFMLGVELTIDPGWHVYWKNPGDSGLPTRVKFSLPDGFTAGDLMFPSPSRLQQAGDIVNYGYENKVLLMAGVTPPKQMVVDQPQSQFSAAVSWLVCQEECVPGKAKLELAIPADTQSKPANLDVFDPWTKSLPVPPADCPDVTKFDVNAVQHQITISWKGDPPLDIQLFPGSVDDYDIKNVTVSDGDVGTIIQYSSRPLAGKSPASTTVEAVVAYKDHAGQKRGIVFALPLSAPATK